MATVTIVKRSRKSGVSYVVNYVDPRTKQKRYHGTFRKWKDADAEKTRLKTLLEGGDVSQLHTRRNTTRGMSFAEVGVLCLEEWKRRVKEGSLSKISAEGYEYSLKGLEREWGRLPVGAITEKMVLELRADIAHRNSPASSNRHLFIMKQVFKRAVREKCLDRNPAAEVSRLNEKQHERKTFLFPEQIDLLLEQAAIGKGKNYLPLAILLAVEHGCSRQEVLDLKWADINFGYGECGLIRFYRTKNNNERYQHIMPRTRKALLERLAHLEQRRAKRSIPVKGDHVVGHLDGTRMNSIKKSWESACERCGFEDLHFHDNRHTYCTNIILAGGSLKHAGAMIGHSDLSMTNRYSNIEGVGGQLR